MSKEAMKLALEALEQIKRLTGARWALENNYAGHLEAITALREALAEQPAQQQEPVYWQWRRKDQPWSLEYTFNSEVQVTTKDSERRALYTSPPAQRTWAGLTDAEWMNIVNKTLDGKPLDVNSMTNFARAIEAKLKEKNA